MASLKTKLNAAYLALDRIDPYIRSVRYHKRMARKYNVRRGPRPSFGPVPPRTLRTHYQNYSDATLGIDPSVFVSHVIGANISGGTDQGDKQNSQVYLKRLCVRGYLRNGQTDKQGYGRLLILKSKRNGEAANLRLFEPKVSANTPGDYETTGRFSQIFEKINADKYQVLADKRYRLQYNTTESSMGNVAPIKFDVTLNRRMIYSNLDGATTTDPELTNPNIWLVFFVQRDDSGSSWGSTNKVWYKFQTYLEYYTQ